VVVLHAVVEAERHQTWRRLTTACTFGQVGDCHDLEPSVQKRLDLGPESGGRHAQVVRILARIGGGDPVVGQHQ
jgi:hypothetical protein